MQRKAKIVATIGPASDSEEILDALIRAGVNVARLNFSHGTHEEHAARITNIRKTAKKLGRSVGILQDLQGPKIRVGKLTESLRLEEGNHIRFYAEEDQPPDEKGKMIPV
ncbi:MAG: pyruvate kinase, partial [Anaerolineae bacterium]|nr:pyruvate kinase [Anaerolineae bacterium]